MKNLFLLSAFLFATLLSYSQDVRFAFRADPQLTWLAGNGEGYEGNGTFLGLNSGLKIDFFFAEKYAFTTGITLNTLKGGAIYEDSLVYNLDNSRKVLYAGSRMTHNLQYISIPLGLKFQTIEIGYSTYWLSTGLTPMINIKSKVSDDMEIFNKTEFKEETKLFNVGYYVEAGLEYSLGGSTALIGGLGFNSGFMDVTSLSDDKLTTKSFSLIFGVVF